MDTRYDPRSTAGAWWLMRHDVAGNSKSSYTSRLLRPFHGRWTREQGTRAFGFSSLSDPRGGYAPAEPPEALTSQLEPVQPGMEC